jgi:hypothetical protein
VQAHRFTKNKQRACVTHRRRQWARPLGPAQTPVRRHLIAGSCFEQTVRMMPGLRQSHESTKLGRDGLPLRMANSASLPVLIPTRIARTKAYGQVTFARSLRQLPIRLQNGSRIDRISSMRATVRGGALVHHEQTLS